MSADAAALATTSNNNSTAPKAPTPATGAPAPKKRKMSLVPIATTTTETKPYVDQSSPVVSLSAEITVPLAAKPALVETVHNAEQLQKLLLREAALAMETRERWARSPTAAWILELCGELTAADRVAVLAKQRALESLGAEDLSSRWPESAELASLIVDRWLAAEGRSLDEVLAKATAFGHMELRGGLVLAGNFVRDGAAGESIGVPECVPMVQALVGGADAAADADVKASVYRSSSDNHFMAEADTGVKVPTDLEAELRERMGSGAGGLGSLNTTHDYTAAAGSEDTSSGLSGVKLLDDFWNKLDDACFVMGGTAASLNPRLYLIWKLQNYCTAYHQDIHVPPHFTLYNQVSGASTFHFLPLLLGLHAARVGRKAGPEALAALLAEYSARGIGEVATIGPKQMLLILPEGAHGVFVPPSSPPYYKPTPAMAATSGGGGSDSTAAVINGAIAAVHKPHELSVIRAAEMFVAPVAAHYEKVLFTKQGWLQPIALTEAEAAAEAAQLEAFAAAQEGVMAAMGNGLSRSEWLFLATRLQRKWEDEKEAGGGAGAEDAEKVDLEG